MTRSKITNMRNNEKEVLMEIENEKIEMTLNTENSIATGLLTQRLTELYDDPVQATIRETVSNAIDAVVVKSSGRPTVKITSPSSLSPIFKVEDNGVGMSYEDLKNIYAKYGASTKMEDLSQIGAYGLGAKAPLAYGNEFTVTSVKDGIKTVIIVAREEITNYIKIVSSTPTDEKSGTTVSVPINENDLNRFATNIEQYKDAPIDQDVDLYVDGELMDNDRFICIDGIPLQTKENEDTGEVEVSLTGRMWIKPSSLTELIYEEDSYSLRKAARFVIGGWAYRVPSSRQFRYTRMKDNFYIELKTGLVGFSSSRDSITENERYVKFEETVLEYLVTEEFKEKLLKQIRNESFDTYVESIKDLLHHFNSWQNPVKLIADSNKIGFHSYSGTIDFTKLTHKETGFGIHKFAEPMMKIPTITSYSEEKSPHRMTAKNSLFVYNRYNPSHTWTRYTITDINKTIDETMNGEKTPIALGWTLLSLFRNETARRNVYTEIITEVNEDNINQIKRTRKQIIKSVLNDFESNADDYRVNIILIEDSADKIADSIAELNKFGLNVKIKNADKALEEAAGLRAKEKKDTKKKTNARLEVNLVSADGRTVHPSEMNPNKHNLIIMTKEYVYTAHVIGNKQWYAEENNLNYDDIDVYYAKGTHRNVDLEILEEYGDVYACEYSGLVGTSQRIREFHEKRKAKRVYVTQNDELLIEKSLALYMKDRISTYRKFSETVETLRIQIESFNEIYPLGLDLTKFNEFIELIKTGADALDDKFKHTGEMTQIEVRKGHYEKNLSQELCDAVSALSEIRRGGYFRDDVNVNLDTIHPSERNKKVDLSDPRTKMQSDVIKVYLSWIVDTVNKGMDTLSK